jgi:hypothetical protein
LKEEILAAWQQERALPKTTDLPLAEEERLIRERFVRQQNLNGAAPTPKAEEPPKLPTIDEMRHQLAASIPVDDASLRSLADQRARHMRDQLAGDGRLGEERVFLTETDVTATGHDKVRSRLNITAGS